MRRRPKLPPCVGKCKLDNLVVIDEDRGGCPEEGIPFETERVILCRVCNLENASGTTDCLAFLLNRIQGAEKQNKAVKARIGRLSQKRRYGL